MRDMYFRYLAVAKKVQVSDQHSIVADANAKRLLEVIALSHAQNRPLTVSAAMALKPTASPQTFGSQSNLWRKLRLIFRKN